MRPRHLALLGLGLLLVAGCHRRPRPAPDAIVFWEPWPEAVVAPLVHAFEAENPGLRVRVHLVSAAALDDSLAAAQAAGAWPDLCAIPGADMPRWLASGALSDWSAGVASQRDSLRGWPLCTVGDALYGLPWLLRPRVLAMSPALFARAGLDASAPPATWAQLRAAAARIQKLGHGVHGFGISRSDTLELPADFLSLAWGNGGDVLSAGLDSSRVDSPENLETLEFMVSLRHVSLVAGADTLRAEFAAGRLGMLLADAGTLGDWGARGAHAPALALVPAPEEDGEHASFADGVVLASFTGSHRKESALRLALALVRPAAQAALARSLRPLQPSVAGADTAAGFATEMPLRVLARQCATARFAPRAARWDSMRVAIAGAVGDAIAGRKGAHQALAGADARVTELAGRK